MAKLLPLITFLTLGSLVACAVDRPQIVAPDYAVAPLDLSTPESTAHAMMMAMYRGDADMVDKVFLEDAALRRVKVDGSVLPDGLKRWRDWVGTLDVGQAHEEIFTLEVEQFGNLATVWAPFVIRFDGEIAGCGVNQLSMALRDGQWRIVSAMDVQAPKDSCATFKENYVAERG